MSSLPVKTLLLLATQLHHSEPFLPPHPKHTSSLSARRQPSTVSDPHGNTPPPTTDPLPTIDLDTLPQAHYSEHTHPIPHQPWRRGQTNGCHDPLTAPWRLRAEAIISDAVRLVGGRLVDVTWYMAQCVISIDESSLSNVVSYTSGMPVRIVYPDETDVTGHVFEDPDDGTDEEYLTEEDEVLDYEQYDDDTEYEILKANMPREYDEETGRLLPPREPRSRDERIAEKVEEMRERYAEEEYTEEKPADGMFAPPVDAKALAVVSQAIMNALGEESVEEELQILSRHDIVLTSPLNHPCILESQSEFDAARDLDVYVETRDPWGSNRVLGGKLVDRNSMDVIINQDNSGRMVTIPHSMIHQVLLPSGLARGSERIRMDLEKEGEDDDDDEEDEDYDEDDEEEEGYDVEEEDFYE